MSQIEQNIEAEIELLVDKVELPTKEEVELIAPSVGVCVCAFSKKPFGEEWSVNGDTVSGFLLNPKTAGKLVENIMSPGNATFKRRSFFDEEVCVKKDLVLNHIEETLSDSMTGYLSQEGWFSEEDIFGLQIAKDILLKDNRDSCDIKFLYPLTTLFDTYLSASKHSKDFLVLAYQKGKVFDKNSKIEFLRIAQNTKIPEDIYVRGSGRYLTLNHPSVDETEKINVADLAVKEMRYYLDEEEQNELRKKVDPKLYTTFLGEVAKIPDSDKNLKAIHASGLKYLEILTESCDKTSDLGVEEFIPKQMLYMSLPETAIASKGRVNPKESKLFQSLKVLLNPYGLKYNEEILTFSKPGRQSVLFGIIKQV